MATKTKPVRREKTVSHSPKNRVRVVTTNRQYQHLCRSSIRRLPAPMRKRVDLRSFKQWGKVDLRADATNDFLTIVMLRLGDVDEPLPRGVSFGARARHMVFVEDLPIEAITVRLMALKVRTASKLHLACETSSDAIAGIIFRMLIGNLHDSHSHRIVDAWIDEEDLVLLSPTFERIRIPFTKLEKRLGSDFQQIKTFEIDEDGSFLFWPHADVHLGWEQCQRLIDPEAILRAEQQHRAFNQRYGAAIRTLREARGLTQASIIGITDRNLRRVEHGELPASTATLRALATAHGFSLDDYMREVTTYLA